MGIKGVEMYSGWAFEQFVKSMANTKYPRNKKPKQKGVRNAK